MSCFAVMRLRRTLLACIAISFAAIDLVHKSIATAEFHHARTPLVALIMVALIAALVVFVPRVPSNAAAMRCGHRVRWCAREPRLALRVGAGCAGPAVVTSALHGVAFNLADLFALTGDALLLSAVVLLRDCVTAARLGNRSSGSF